MYKRQDEVLAKTALTHDGKVVQQDEKAAKPAPVAKTAAKTQPAQAA